MMTRKDFRLAAETISKITNKEQKLLAASLWIETFTKSNPRFKKDLFLKACGL